MSQTVDERPGTDATNGRGRKTWYGRIRSASPGVLSVLALLVSSAQAYPQVKASLFPAATCANHRDLKPVSTHELTATATSTLPPERGNTYVAGNAVDGDATTAWAPAGGDGGAGKQLFIHLVSPEDLRLACVINGYAKDSDLYLRNARIHDVTVQTDAGTVTGTLTDLPPDESHEYQDLPLPKGSTTQVSITVTTSYSGISNNGLGAHQDLCVSEIMFYRL